MKTETVRTADDALLDAVEFADRHLDIRHLVAGHLDLANLVETRGGQIFVPLTFKADSREALGAIVTAALVDRIPVTLNPVGGYIEARIDFNGLFVVPFDYETTYSEDSQLYALVAEAGVSA